MNLIKHCEKSEMKGLDHKIAFIYNPLKCNNNVVE